MRKVRAALTAARVYAQQAGWRLSGAMGAADGVVRNIYGPGRKVGQADAIRLAAALEEVVNGKHGDSGDLDLDGICYSSTSCGLAHLKFGDCCFERPIKRGSRRLAATAEVELF
jgi:hypothetical protein